MTQPQERPLLEAALENAEVFTDALLHDEVLKDIPVVGTAVKVCKALDTFRDRAFAAKLTKFVLGFGNEKSRVASKWRKQLMHSPPQAQKVGETLFLVLERLNDIDKADILAKIFCAYVDDIVSSDELRRITQAIDIAFIDDLQSLLLLERNPDKNIEHWFRYLSASGLTQPATSLNWDDIGGENYYSVSPLGVQLQTAYRHGRQVIG